MSDLQRKSNLKFVEILGLGGLWLCLSLGLIWHYAHDTGVYIYQLCQTSLTALLDHLPGDWLVLVPLTVIIVLGRGLVLLHLRLRATRRFRQTLALAQVPRSARLDSLLQQAGLPLGVVVCFESSVAQAFSLGIWRPQIWVSTALLALLDNEELLAVLHHEAHHCRQRDPLRLLVSRLISDSFFFVPFMRRLLDDSRLAQEMVADAVAIARTGTPLPLASALHKLLTKSSTPPPNRWLVISQINITERRILALVSPEKYTRWPLSLLGWGVGMGLIYLIMLNNAPLAESTAPYIITACIS